MANAWSGGYKWENNRPAFMTLREIRLLLDQHQLQLTRSMGQNFLHDAHQLQRIADAADVQPGDRVLEVGPGLGPLTEILLARGAQVLALEADRQLCDLLRERLPHPALELVHADALDVARRDPRSWSDWKLVANLPYSIASPLLVELASRPRPPRRLVATLQLEVAQRIASGPSCKDYGLLTLLLQLRYAPGPWFKISASCFFPKPNVDSACLRLDRRDPPVLPPEYVPTFERLIRTAFSQRRKMALKLLRGGWPQSLLADAFARLGLAPNLRAEALSLEQFVALTRLLHRPRTPS